MVRGRRISVAVLIVLIGVISGCAGKSPFARFGSHASAKNDAGSQLTVKVGNQQSEDLAEQLQKAQQPKKKSFNQYVSSAFKKKKPKVDKVPDATDLKNSPETVSAEVFISTARVFESRNNAQAAEVQYQKALRVEPNNLTALISLARLKDRQGDFDGAIKIYRRAALAHPENALPQNDKGLCYARHGDLQASIASLSRGVKLQPKNKQYRNNLATVLVQAGRPDDAFAHLKAAHGDAAAHYNLGYLLHSHDKTQPAVEQFALALKKDPSLGDAQKMLDRIQGDTLQQNIADGSKENVYRITDDESSSSDEQDFNSTDQNLTNRASGNAPLDRSPQSDVQRAGQFQGDESADESTANYPTIRLPEVNNSDWQESEGPLPPTPEKFDVGTDSVESPLLLPPVE